MKIKEKEELKAKPIRTCVFTKKKYEKQNLLRFVKNEKGEYELDKEQKMQKRAIYLFPNEKVLDIMEKNKKYTFSIKTQEEIRKYIKAGGKFE